MIIYASLLFSGFWLVGTKEKDQAWRVFKRGENSIKLCRSLNSICLLSDECLKCRILLIKFHSAQSVYAKLEKGKPASQWIFLISFKMVSVKVYLQKTIWDILQIPFLLIGIRYQWKISNWQLHTLLNHHYCAKPFFKKRM